MTRIDTAEKIDNKYIRIDDLPPKPGESPGLGLTYKAYDTEAKRYVRVLLLHDWCALLPEETLNHLQLGGRRDHRFGSGQRRTSAHNSVHSRR